MTKIIWTVYVRIGTKLKVNVLNVMKDAPSGKTFVLKSSNIVLSGTSLVTVFSAKRVTETKIKKVLMALVLNFSNKI